jgi:hypothetical protein
LTFGYTTAGATGPTYPSSARCLVVASSTYTAVTGDTLVKYSLYGRNIDAGNKTSIMTAYTVVAGAATALLATGTNITIPQAGSATWYHSSAVSQSLTNGVTYGVAIGYGTNNLYQYYDTGPTNSVDREADYTFGATWVHSAWSTVFWSIYATYAASGGTPASPS